MVHGAHLQSGKPDFRFRSGSGHTLEKMLIFWLEAEDTVVGNDDVVGEGGSFPEEVGPRGAELAKPETCRMQICQEKMSQSCRKA